MRNRLIIITLLLALSGCESPELAVCDREIKQTLKAPASFKRVSAVAKGGHWKIEYDAVNSFNAPLRGWGTCSVYGSDAVWFENQSIAE